MQDDLACVTKEGWNYVSVEACLQFLGLFEVGATDLELSSSLDRALSWEDVEEEGWLVVVEDIFILGSITASIQSDLNTALMPVVTWRGDAHCSRRVGHDSWYPDLKILKVAEGVIRVIDFIKFLFEWEEVTALEHDLSASLLWTPVRNEVLNGGLIVVPKEERVS